MFSVAVLAGLFLHVEFANAIRCYECSSHNNSMCEDPSLYDEESLNKFLKVTDCRQGILSMAPERNEDFFCRKIQQTILHKHHDSQIRITRTCGWRRDPKNRECYKADNDDHLETVCQCFTDKCNSATNLRGFAMTLATSAVILLLSKVCREV